MSQASPTLTPPPGDQGLHCLKCDYNLTGLTSSRCPECGSEIDWPKVKAQHEWETGTGGTPWERWRWYLKPAAFVVTSLEAAILPWRFARRLPARPRMRWPLAFGGLCFAAALLAVLRSSGQTAEAAVYAISMLACLLVQSMVFAILVPPRRARPFLFWLVAGLYLSYPVAVEFLYFEGGRQVSFFFGSAFSPGSPLPIILIGDGIEATVWPFSSWSGWLDFDPLSTVLFYLWWLDLVAVMLVRCRSVSRWRLVVAGLMVLPLTVGASYLGLLLFQVFDLL